MRPVRDAARMQRDVSGGNVVAAHEIAVHVIQHLIRINVAVVVRGRNGLRMVIVEARAEGTHHKCGGLEGDVDGGRLVYAPRNRFEIMD